MNGEGFAFAAWYRFVHPVAYQLAAEFKLTDEQFYEALARRWAWLQAMYWLQKERPL